MLTARDAVSDRVDRPSWPVVGCDWIRRPSRSWVLPTEAVPGGWGLGGHANTNEELIAAARAEIAKLSAS